MISFYIKINIFEKFKSKSKIDNNNITAYWGLFSYLGKYSFINKKRYLNWKLIHSILVKKYNLNYITKLELENKVKQSSIICRKKGVGLA